MESVDKNLICRLCLLGSDNLTNIFQVYDKNGFIAADLIKDLLQFKVSETDGYPPIVCHPCLSKLTNFKHFKEQCLTSKVTYDNVFSAKEEIMDCTRQSNDTMQTTIKEEEVDIDFSSDVRYEQRIVEDKVNEVSCGPILLKYEVLPFNNPQEELIEPDASVNLVKVTPAVAFMEDYTQECEDPLLSVSDEEGKCEVDKCRDLQVKEANNGKCFGEYDNYGSKREEQLRGCTNWKGASHGNIPAGSFVGGNDRDSVLFVARATQNNALLPGKLNPNHKCCYVSWGGKEYRKDHYEVLCGNNFEWVPCSKAHIPRDAVLGGKSENGENLYIGRVPYNGTITLGKVHPSHGTCYIPYDGKEIGFTKYEILVFQKS